ncbi:hypothetical protein PHMEG_00023690 [Phytophthora megakarya]|uniref:Uncharacterized protein n=1 Tax=Phytophthora megakarya TaxID=4795 RepID=A0A225VGG7_9STRA|nr:hypothetical protein PHMEG_00023690 [Phytophthora megakarya]
MTIKKICSEISVDETGDIVHRSRQHLLELYLALAAISIRRLQNIASILDNHCAKRGTDFVQQAPLCTKADLCSLLTVMCSGARTPNDYKDASLLGMLWYLLGRSSDTACLGVHILITD